MKVEILNTILVASSISVLFGVSELLYRKFKVEVEYTRKLIHIGSGLICMSFPILFTSPLIVAGLSLGFFGILATSKRINLLPSVNAVKRKSSGSFWFPLVVPLCFLSSVYFGNTAFFYVPILTLTLADSAACLVGRKKPIKNFHFNSSTKSIGGTAAFFTISFLIGVFFLKAEFHNSLAVCFLFASATCLAELFGGQGHDNVTIPLSATLIMSLFYSPLIYA